MDDTFTLVTGGAGFIGSHLVDALLTDGHDVRVLDDFSTGKDENLDEAWALAAQGGAGLQVMEGDVRDEVRVRDVMDGCGAVVHLAAVPSVAQSMEDPVGCDSVTHGGTVNVVRQAVEAGVQRVVLASSCAVYGDAAQLPIAETTPARPLSPYAGAKLASEEVCMDAADAGQITAVCLRFFNVYGPRQDPGSAYSGVISRFLAAAAAGEPVTLYGDGRQTRDFVYVADVVRAIRAALSRPLVGATVVNVGTGRETDLLQILDVIDERAGRRLERRLEPPRDGDIRHSCADARRAGWVLGWEAVTPLAAGLAHTWAWFSGGYGAEVATWRFPPGGRDGE
ncbi:MAG: NAD-dependent epimerase/dehydratase family protein [Actinobacteria bacterium]|nr:NAD-dependent epimerase/dehydratase family protein [Actinomycetota bacterium]